MLSTQPVDIWEVERGFMEERENVDDINKAIDCTNIEKVVRGFSMLIKLGFLFFLSITEPISRTRFGTLSSSSRSRLNKFSTPSRAMSVIKMMILLIISFSPLFSRDSTLLHSRGWMMDRVKMFAVSNSSISLNASGENSLLLLRAGEFFSSSFSGWLRWKVEGERTHRKSKKKREK